MALLANQPLDIERLIASVASPSHGAITTFSGVVRDHNDGNSVASIEYGAYPEMAERVAAELIAEAHDRWPVRVALAHRVGALEVGETAVVVVVASPHRAEAFAACRYLIDQLKIRVPIWKHEHYTDGDSCWVGSDTGSDLA